MRDVLSAAGYSVGAVEDSLAALGAVQERRFRAIIMRLGIAITPSSASNVN